MMIYVLIVKPCFLLIGNHVVHFTLPVAFRTVGAEPFMRTYYSVERSAER